MKALNKIFSCIPLLVFFFGNSQQLDWNQINSNTVVNMISQKNSEPDASSAIVLQFGNNNNADISVNAKTDIVVHQLGDRNSIYYNNAFTDQQTKTTISTEGYHNNIDVTGSNSISDKMQLNIKGDHMTVFMRNY